VLEIGRAELVMSVTNSKIKTVMPNLELDKVSFKNLNRNGCPILEG